MSLKDIAASLEAFAVQGWDKVKAEAITIEQEVEPVIESGLAQAVSQFGQLAVQTVMNLMTAAGASLSGGEKLNLTVTTITDAAEKAGVALAAQDATALAQNAYTAVIGTAPAAGETVVQEAAQVVEKAVGDVVEEQK